MSKLTIDEKWDRLANATMEEAQKLPHGKEREALERKARQLLTASHINDWLSSKGLQAPE
jgi:hypothetical protein